MAKSQNEIEAERRRGIKQGLPNGVIFTDDSTNTLPAEPLSIPSLETLLGYSHEDLAALARRLACECGQAVWMTEEEAELALYDVLLKKGLKGDITAVREYFDRKKGKAQQNIKQDVDIAATITRIECVIIDPMVIEGKP